MSNYYYPAHRLDYLPDPEPDRFCQGCGHYVGDCLDECLFLEDLPYWFVCGCVKAKVSELSDRHFEGEKLSSSELRFIKEYWEEL